MTTVWSARRGAAHRLALMFLLLLSLANAQTDSKEQTNPNFKADFEKIAQNIEKTFYDPKLHGVDWKKIKTSYEKQAVHAQTIDEFSQIINRMLLELKASHVGFFTPNDVEYYMMKSVFSRDIEGNQVEHIGAFYNRAEKGYQVRMVLERTPAEEAGIRAGDEVITADGQPFHPLFSFKGKEGKTVVLKLKNDKRTYEAKVIPKKENILRAFFLASQASVRILEQGGKKIGYIHLWCQSHPRFLTLLQNTVSEKFADTDAVILDLRDGYGGSPDGYADPFFKPSITIEWNSRSGKNVQRGGYNKPLIVLINEGTRSAKEILSYQLKSSGRATLIGSTTAGHVLGATGIEINKTGLLELPVVDLKVDGKRLEGVGVSPNIEVAKRFDEKGKDLTLDRALIFLQARLNRDVPAH